jgi:hypothetical protein
MKSQMVFLRTVFRSGSESLRDNFQRVQLQRGDNDIFGDASGISRSKNSYKSSNASSFEICIIENAAGGQICAAVIQ